MCILRQAALRAVCLKADSCGDSCVVCVSVSLDCCGEKSCLNMGLNIFTFFCFQQLMLRLHHHHHHHYISSITTTEFIMKSQLTVVYFLECVTDWDCYVTHSLFHTQDKRPLAQSDKDRSESVWFTGSQKHVCGFLQNNTQVKCFPYSFTV